MEGAGGGLPKNLQEEARVHGEDRERGGRATSGASRGA